MPFGGSKDKSKAQEPKEPANIPPHLTDLHCFSETDGVVTTSTSRAQEGPRFYSIKGRIERDAYS